MRNIVIPEIVNDPLFQMRGIGPRMRHPVAFHPVKGPQPEGRIPRPVFRSGLVNRMVERITREPQLAPLSRIRSFLPYGMSEGSAPGFWSSITGAISSTIQSAIPALASVQVAKIQANQNASLLRAQAGLYTPQNIATLQQQGAFEAAQRANMAAAASGSTTAPLTTGTMIALGVAALGGLYLITRKK